MIERTNYATSSATTTIDEGLRQHMLSVYNYMTAGLLVTALTSWLAMYTPLGSAFFANTPQGYTLSGLGWLVMFAPLALIFGFNWVLTRGTLSQVRNVFWGFSALMGLSIAPILTLYTGASVVKVFLITSATFGSMSLYGYTTKKDLTGMGAFMRMGLWGVIIASIVNMFMRSSGMGFVISILTVVIFTGLTAYDTQKIRQMYMSSDSSDTAGRKAVAAALSLYMDFINMFLALLRLFGDRR